jgi:hypothetical protein
MLKFENVEVRDFRMRKPTKKRNKTTAEKGAERPRASARASRSQAKGVEETMAAPANRSLEERIRAIEDRLEIYNIIAGHPPSADTGGNEHICASWVEDGVFDRGDILSSARGRATIAEQVLGPEHQAAIARGLAHCTGLPHVAITGDTAVVTSYLQIVVPQTQGDPVDVPNHGSSKGFRIHRMTANRWQLVRTPQGWKIKHRTLRQLDGSEPARRILAQAIAKQA